MLFLCSGKLWLRSLNVICRPTSMTALRPRQNGRHFADDVFKCIFLNENVGIPIIISLKIVPKGTINNIPSLVQIMACRLSAPSHYLNQWWLVYWRIYASRGLNELVHWFGQTQQRFKITSNSNAIYFWRSKERQIDWKIKYSSSEYGSGRKSKNKLKM